MIFKSQESKWLYCGACCPKAVFANSPCWARVLKMIKVIEGKRYNTETAESVFGYWNGKSTSDFGYRTKTLYRTKAGAWFMHHKGGARTDMAVSYGSNSVCGSENLEPIGDDDAYGFLEAHSDEEDAQKAIDKYFASRVVDA